MDSKYRYSKTHSQFLFEKKTITIHEKDPCEFETFRRAWSVILIVIKIEVTKKIEVVRITFKCVPLCARTIFEVKF